MQRKYYFEDFAPGDVWEMEGPIITVAFGGDWPVLSSRLRMPFMSLSLAECGVWNAECHSTDRRVLECLGWRTEA